MDYWNTPEDLDAKPVVEGSHEHSHANRGEFNDTPIEKDGPGQTAGQTDEDRRDFLKLMGASFALMTASACTKRPVEKIVPYLKQPEEITPGIANWYASTCGECDSGCGILVKTREGRPIKFEGNPAHPTSQGGLCARGQASVLNVYDPDRLQQPVASNRKGEARAITWEEVDTKLASRLRAARQSGGKVRLLTGEIISPTTQKLISEFLQNFPEGKHVVYEPLSAEETAAAQEASYGKAVLPRYRLEKAEYVVTFGSDFLGTEHSSIEHNKNFSKTRKLGQGKKKMSKLVAFESILTLTGSNADERHVVKSGDELKAALALAHELIVTQGRTRYAGDSEVTGLLRAYPTATIAKQIGIPAEVFNRVAAELWENRGRGIVFGGGHTTKGDGGISIEVIANLLNSALENEGATIDGTVSPSMEKSSFAALTKLIADMKAGRVDVLLIHRSNPAYFLPKALGFEEALAKVPLVVTSSMFFDETAKLSDFVLAASHHTEAWGDASPAQGVYSIQQPTIHPLYSTRNFEENLIAWARPLGLGGAISSTGTWHEYLKNNWRDSVHRAYGVSTPFALFWESLLREGVFDGLAARGSRNSSSARSFAKSSLKLVSAQAANSGMRLVLYPKISQFDGRVANNSWLQELPDPITKITWDNYLCLSVNKAKALGVREGDVLVVKANNISLELPAHIQPGLHDDTVAAAVGYGRQGAGRVGTGIGVNTFPFAVAGTSALNLAGLSVTIEKTGRNSPLAATQKHHSYEGRPIIKEATFGEYVHNPHAGNEEHEELTTLWHKHDYPGYRWAMAIDLNSCTGCSSCVIACQAENNIPTVGKRFVLSSREMHWLRIDRYYSGRADNPETVHQPMLCQHCENAPCETVCPVLATMHNDEGLNQQVYNRCVGTRYCANNCPYKVRRFNWFTFTDVAKPLNLAYNPDITVRTRGIMEKCTFCMQRIRDAKDRAKDMDTKVKDGDVKTACQQSCPTDAIVFGDINDKASRVAHLAKDPRGYHVLAEINTRPSITYLTKIRNKKA